MRHRLVNKLQCFSTHVLTSSTSHWWFSFNCFELLPDELNTRGDWQMMKLLTIKSTEMKFLLNDIIPKWIHDKNSADTDLVTSKIEFLLKENNFVFYKKWFKLILMDFSFWVPQELRIIVATGLQVQLKLNFLQIIVITPILRIG